MNLLEIFDNIILEATVQEIKEKYYPNVPQEAFEQIVNADTLTSNLQRNKIGMYGKWLLNLYVKGNLKLEDLYKATEYMPIFDKIAKANKLDNKDINSYKSLSDMFTVIKPYYNTNQTISKGDEERNIKQSGTKKIYEDEEFLVINPTTQEAACYYGKNTQWCTAATSSNNMFDHYNSLGPLYVVIDKKNNRKYQFHYETNSFMDENDEAIDFEANPNLIKIAAMFPNNMFKTYSINSVPYIMYKPHTSLSRCIIYNSNGQEVLYYDDEYTFIKNIRILVKYNYNDYENTTYALYDMSTLKPIFNWGVYDKLFIKRNITSNRDNILYAQKIDNIDIFDINLNKIISNFKGNFQITDEYNVVIFDKNNNKLNFNPKNRSFITKDGYVLYNSNKGTFSEEYDKIIKYFGDGKYLVRSGDGIGLLKFPENKILIPFGKYHKIFPLLDDNEWLLLYNKEETIVGYYNIKTEQYHNTESNTQENKTISILNIFDKILNETSLSDIKKAEKEVNINPSEKQIESGNYKKGHITIQGFDISIEQPKGSIRSGIDDDGNKWSQKMNNTYGYFNRTEGKDGDHIDVFIGDNLESNLIFVVDQINPKTKEFDEHKCMLGFDNITQAKKAYLSNYEKNWKGLGEITEIDIDTFKNWLYNGSKRIKEFSNYIDINEGTKADQNKYDLTRSFIEDIFNNFDDEEQIKYLGTTKYRLYKQIKKFLSIFPLKFIEYIKKTNIWDAAEDLANYFVYNKVNGVYSTYALLKQSPEKDTTVSYWKNKGYYLSDYNLKTLDANGFLTANLNMGLNNIWMNEENSRLAKSGQTYQIPPKIMVNLHNLYNKVKDNSQYSNLDGYKRLSNFIDREGKITYEWLKRIKNYFDHYSGNGTDIVYQMNGGNDLKKWCDKTLKQATEIIKNGKETMKNNGIENSFIQTHYKDKMNANPTGVNIPSININNINKDLNNNNVITYK